MAEKPSYLGLLNGISIGEGRAAEYLGAWMECTTDPDLRATLRTVAARELEHSVAFAKRIDELGFEVRETPNSLDFSKQMEIVTSDCSDYEKAEALGLFKDPPSPDEPDVFDGFFRDHTIDIQTGALLGRYIAEERDTTRMIADCAAKLKARHEAANGSVASDRLAALESKLDEVCAAVTELTALVAGSVPERSAGTENANGKSTKTKARASS
jgi:hypothetical protein